MKRFLRIVLILVFSLLAGWFLLTIWAESPGSEKSDHWYASYNTSGSVLILYDADPFYNLDEQLCRTFGSHFFQRGWNVTISTVPANLIVADSFDLYVFCANTYNWSPDFIIMNCINKSSFIDQKKVIAITVGGGSTDRAKRVMDAAIKKQNGLLLASRSFWLWRPNDHNRPEEPNTIVANDLIAKWADSLTISLAKR